MMVWRVIACVVLGYLFGGWNGAIIISRRKMHEDVRSKGSGNAGMTNFLRSYGGWATLLVVAVDAFKTVAACLIAALLMPQDPQLGKMIAGFAVQIGHIFPIYYGFRGGKGILCAAFVALTVDWRIFAIAFALFLIIFFTTRYVSLASISACVVYAALFVVFFWGRPQIWSIGIAIAVLAVFMHRSNIVRLVQGKERKTHFHKYKNEEEAS